MKKKVCFFVKMDLKTDDGFKRIRFYSQDIQILEEMGYEVYCVSSIRKIVRADLYFTWFWTWAFIPAVLAALYRKPLVIVGVFNGWRYNTMPIYKKLLIRASANYAQWNLLTSRFELEQVKSIFPSNKTVYAQLGVDSDIYCPKGINREDFVYSTITMTGGNALRKCVPELIQSIPLVLKKFPKMKFILAGLYDDYFKEMVFNIGIENNIEFPGAINEERKVDYLQRCKIYVQPSRFEGFGLGIAEAMSCGVPVVTSPVGAVPELVGGNAVFVDGSSPECIADGICSILGDEQKQQKLSKLGRKRIIEFFSYERRKKQLNELIIPLVKI